MGPRYTVYIVPYNIGLHVNTVVKTAVKTVATTAAHVTFAQSAVDVKEICLWHLGSQLGVEMGNGKRVEGRHKETCRNLHRSLLNTTKNEAKVIIGKMTNGKLKTSFEKQVNTNIGFKKSPTKST